MTKYQFNQWGDESGKSCSCCGYSNLQSGWTIDGAVFGPSCGIRELKNRGITWPTKFGPGSFDSAAMESAIRLSHTGTRRLTPTDRKEIEECREVVGRIGWRIARDIGGAVAISGENSMKCYQIALEAWNRIKSEI